MIERGGFTGITASSEMTDGARGIPLSDTHHAIVLKQIPSSYRRSGFGHCYVCHGIPQHRLWPLQPND